MMLVVFLVDAYSLLYELLILSIFINFCYEKEKTENGFPIMTVKSMWQDGEHRIIPQKLYSPDHGSRNMSVLSSICIIPYSRLFVVGTEDGYLRMCC